MLSIIHKKIRQDLDDDGGRLDRVHSDGDVGLQSGIVLMYL